MMVDGLGMGNMSIRYHLYDYLNIEATIEDEHYLRTVYNSHKEPLYTFGYSDHGSCSGYTHKNASYTYKWDKSGTITKTDQANQRHLYTLDKHKHIDKVVYPDGSFTTCSYDELRRTYTEVTRGGNIRVKTFDEKRRVLEEKFNDEIEQTFTYEGANPHPVCHSCPVSPRYGRLVQEVKVIA